MKVVFMGTPDFSVPTLEALFNNGHEISLVISQADKAKGRGKKVLFTPVKEKALQLDLNVYQPDNINSEESIEIIKKESPDVIVVVAYGQILKEDILNIPKFGCINVHASLLPEYRGAAPINWAIINGEKRTGVTTMVMERGLDSGDMLLKNETKIYDGETAGGLHDRLMKIGAELLIETIKGLETGDISRTPQNHENATYAPMMSKDLGKIKWNEKADNIRNLVRGTQPWPGAFTTYKDNNMKILEVDIVAKFKDEESGRVVKVNNDGIYVNALDNCILIKQIQFPGKKGMSVSDFLRGNEFEIGALLK
ncbi:methionyl-tRNA formyltransferase [Proteiniborus sp. MB09-C3]|uniref:methionyl-tRNA formyltransferase n=1 Tax=Proteiniborus sp. MB09-C3 TaxID=3050072 RepID=UPI002552B75E|nr:methionyl-tRNA formyltransferase [Proteiniborus sp. MB09-C3]WIV10801.1 methionyl-tRNA formyltransferase [Proteiniborus sp. MB09-C3]